MIFKAVTILGLSAENTAAEFFNLDLHLQYEKAQLKYKICTCKMRKHNLST